MTDHEINLKLARWMGWREIQSTGRQPGDFYQEIGESMAAEPARFFLMDDGSICPVGKGRNAEAWTPLSNPAQAVEVMAEVARRGGLVETYFERWLICAHAYMPKPTDAVRVPPASVAAEEIDADPVAGWCRSVCLAINEATKAIPGDQHENAD